MKYIFVAIVSLAIFGSASVSTIFSQDGQQRADTWRSLTPLLSTVQEVEKVLGEPTSTDGIVSRYDKAEARITIWYSGAERYEPHCKERLAKDTMVSMVVSPKKRWLLSQMGYDLAKFKRVATSDDEIWDYVSETLGIRIETHTLSVTDSEIIFVHFSPTVSMKKEKCIRPN